MMQNVISHPGHACDPTASSEMCPVIHLGTLSLCYGYVLLFMLEIFGKNQMCLSNPLSLSSLLFFLFAQAQMYRPTQLHRHIHTGTTSKPCDLARHYANGQTCHLPEISLRHSARERRGGSGVCGCVCVRACVLGKFCTFASF